MSYYAARGDYYGGRSHYYRRGDPGFFNTIGSFLRNTVAPAVLTAVNPALGAAYVGARSAYTATKGAAKAVAATVVKHPVLSGAGAAAVAAGGEYILNTRRGGTSRTLPAMRSVNGMSYAGGGGRRRMNVTNSKALRRAIRRARGFEKLARKVLGFSSPHKPKGRVYFKKSRKK